MKKHLLFLIVVSGLFLTTTSYAGEKWLSPEHVEGAITTDLETAKKLYDQGTIFVDVRSLRLFTKKHITGAHHLDLKNHFTRETLGKVASPEQAIVIYCSGIKCSRSYRASAYAVAWGYKKVHYFRGGMVAWRKAGFPLTWKTPR